MTTTDRVGAAQIHFLVILAMAIAADATREFKSATPAAVKSRDELIMEWLKITAVPLGVLLMGACLWGCIKKSAWWRAFLELIACDRRKVSIAPEADAMQLAGRLPNSSSQHGSDLEEGNAASHRRMGDDSAISTCTDEMMQQPALRSAYMITSSSVDVAPQL